MTQEEINERVKTFIDIEEHSCSPVMISPESVARMCGITVEEATTAGDVVINEFRG